MRPHKLHSVIAGAGLLAAGCNTSPSAQKQTYQDTGKPEVMECPGNRIRRLDTMAPTGESEVYKISLHPKRIEAGLASNVDSGLATITAKNGDQYLVKRTGNQSVLTVKYIREESKANNYTLKVRVDHPAEAKENGFAGRIIEVLNDKKSNGSHSR